jgi:hypothetical protein
MLSEQRSLHLPLKRPARFPTILGSFLFTLLLPVLSACAPAAGGGVLAAALAIGALTTRCYDYIDVSVYAPNGHKTCVATVTASDGGGPFELNSCYYTPLSDGRWTIRASLPGLPSVATVVLVDHSQDCTRHVQSMELTLAAPVASPKPKPVSAPLPPSVPLPVPPPEASSSSATPVLDSSPSPPAAPSRPSGGAPTQPTATPPAPSPAPGGTPGIPSSGSFPNAAPIPD